MSDVESNSGSGRLDAVKDRMSDAGNSLKSEVRSFAGAAQERVATEAQKGVETAGKTLGDFANAVRRAGDELAGADQNPAARLVGKAADGLEQFSRSLEGKDPGDLLDAVRDFGRRNPLVFVGGAVLVGLALGRFARASDRRGSEALAQLEGPATPAPYTSPYMDTASEATTSVGMGSGTSGFGAPSGSVTGTGL